MHRDPTIANDTAVAAAAPSTTALEPATPRSRTWSVARRLRPAWDEAPLRVKVGMLTTAGTVFGVLLGMLEARMGHQVWPMMGGLTVLLGGLWVLGQCWIAGPIDRLLLRLTRLARSRERLAVNRLPVQRQDEVGQIARRVHQIAMVALRCETEVRTLQRTLDTRVAQATQEATRQLRRMVLRDPLTDLGNRRFLDEYLEPVVAMVDASGTDLLCIAIDVDNFKQVNDTHGHAAGDDILVLLASLIRACVRHDDLAARLGGDEFVVFLPSAGLDRAEQLARTIHSLFRQQVKAMHPTEPRPDLSIGVASLRRDGCPDAASLLAKADEYLYAAKRAGKGQMAGLA